MRCGELHDLLEHSNLLLYIYFGCHPSAFNLIYVEAFLALFVGVRCDIIHREVNSVGAN